MASERPTIADLPDDYLLCRRGGLMHSWQPNPTGRVDGTIARAATFVISTRCDRCTNEKFVYLDSKRRKIGHYYRPPKGYATQRANADDVLAEIASRSLLIQRLGASRADGTVRVLPPPAAKQRRKAS